MIEFLNCDCMEYMRTLPNNAFDLAIVDPPYNIVSQQKRGIGSRIDLSGKMNDWNNLKPSPEYWCELFRVSKNQIIWGANNFILPETEYFIVWDKHQSVENFASAEYAWTNCKMPAKVYRYTIHEVMADRKAEGGKIHPTQKPVSLYRWLLQNYAKCKECGGSKEVASLTIDCDVQTCGKCKNYKILDTHGGSMSHAIAADMEGYDLVIMEKDKDYFDAAVKRFNQYKSQTTLFSSPTK